MTFAARPKRAPPHQTVAATCPPCTRPLVPAAVAFLGLCLLFPTVVLGVLTLIAVLAMLGGIVLKFAALVAALRRAPAPTVPPAAIARLPTVSILVALLHEADIAPRLVRRLGRLDYPRDRLDVLLAVEENDHADPQRLAACDLPDWMRIVIVPQGRCAPSHAR